MVVGARMTKKTRTSRGLPSAEIVYFVVVRNVPSKYTTLMYKPVQLASSMRRLVVSHIMKRFALIVHHQMDTAVLGGHITQFFSKDT